jgi:Trk-type K+ transport system membrane component
MVIALEWTNPGTLGPLSTPGKLLAGFFQGVTPRTAGFNTLDYGAMRETTWLGTMLLMFIGGGSASTAGGVKVTTIALLGAMVVAEARGDETVDLMGRRIPGPAQRQALSIVVLAVAAIALATFFIMAMGETGLARTLFETISAFGTVGLSTGITADLSGGARVILIFLMFLGRVGPLTLGAALAMREHRRLYKLPEERPIVG